MKDLRAIVWLVPLLALGGCKAMSAKSCHSAQPYMDAKSVPPLNPLMVTTAAAAFAAVWLGGIYLPARRATAVDPSRALRWE